MRDWIGTLGWELRLASRSLTRRPGFLAVTVLTLALAIGANTAVFSALRSVVLRPLAVPGADRLVMLRQDAPALPLLGAQLSVPEVLDLAAERSLFEGVAGWIGRSFNLTGVGDPDRILGVATVGPFFEVFQVNPVLGRLYRPEDSQGGNVQVAVLSHSFWRTAFGGDQSVIGRSIQLNEQAFEIIGVLPENLTYPRTGQVFVPYQIQERDRQPQGRGVWAVTAIGRLRPDVDPASLPARLADVSVQWHQRYGGYDPATGHQLTGQSFSRWLAGELRGFLVVLQAAVLFLLLIACANVGNLQLVRATERERELAVRAALGAGRWSIVRQLVLESGLIALGGGALGIALAAGAVALLRQLEIPELRALATLQVDRAVLAYSGLVTLAATALFGLLPAWRTGRPDLNGLIREGARGSAAGRFRLLRAGVVAQVALSFVLVLGAGALVRSLGRLLAIDPGFEAEHVTSFRVSLPTAAYPEAAQRIAAFDALAERVAGLPGVISLGYITDIPFGTGRNSSPFRIIGRPESAGGPQLHADMRFVHAGYFETMGIPLLSGRRFEPGDGAEAGDGPVPVVIDRRLAEEFFPGEDPIGRRVNQGPDGIIVGVVGSIKHGTLEEDAKATVYYPYRRMNWVTTLTGVIRTSGGPITLAQLQAEMAAVDSRLPVFDLRTMRDRIDGSLGPRRLGTTVLSGFGLTALLLALLGVYGVLSYSISQRTRELGIRLALGARPRQLVGAVTGSGLVLGGIGVATGLLLFAGANRLLQSLVYGVKVMDPVAIGAGIFLLGIGVLLASFLPARRIVRVDPTSALREE